ncbi:hypothetical protein Lal_00028162 [Lupinus albus]|nr:hypothetical protein Lal_00028162 [Lupinus albus]
MKQYFGSSYVATLWLKLCSNTLAQVMKQYFGSSYVAMLWLKLCSKILAQGEHNPLPYAIIVTSILKHFGISNVGESMIELDVRDSKIDVDVIHKMGLFRDPIDLLFKYNNDELIAPTNIPSNDQDESQPSSSFHVDSSSSSAMPMSQMIMNELVSLRCFITIRMDILDV